MFKEKLESHAVIVLLGVAVAAFAMGWQAHIAVQEASGLEAVTKDKLQDLKRKSEFGKEDLIKEINLLKARIVQFEKSERSLKARLLKNAPAGKNYISNIVIKPYSTGKLKIGERLKANLDYNLAEGVEARIFMHGNGPISSYEPSGYLSHKGSTTRSISSRKAGLVTELTFQIYNPDTENYLHTIKIPVSILFE